jgi:hypothetical protein
VNSYKADKSPRDFVYQDRFIEADKNWPRYFYRNCIWLYADEYHAALSGDEDYSRIVIHVSESYGWLYSRPLQQRDKVLNTLNKIQAPVSVKQLRQLGFIEWHDEYI